MSRRSVLCLISLLALAAAPALAGERHTLTYVKTEALTVSRSSFEIGDVPNHTLVQEVQHHRSTFSDPQFTPKDEWVHSLTEETDGTGTHRGHFLQIHEGGDRTYGSFEGHHVTINRPDGSWAVKWEGTYRYLGGSGRYRGIRGEGTYTGRSTPNEPFHEEGKETIEY